MGKNLAVVGIGPGGMDYMTPDAYRMLSESDLIVGYQLYVDLIRDSFPDKQFYTTGMRKEIDRILYAVDSAAGGISTAVVCSGDSQVYGMASLVFEAAQDRGLDPADIVVVPGITAALSCGAILGSPLSCDFAVISLSDLLVPWERIETRLRAAAEADFSIVLYNPGSLKRKDHLRRACEIMARYKPASTVCGIVRNAGRQDTSYRLTDLGRLHEEQVDMLSTVFIGTGDTQVIGGRMVEPRGYTDKYDLRQDGRNSGKSGSAGRKELLIFGGTTEGRTLAKLAADAGYSVTLSVVSEYGRETAKNVGKNVEILSGKMAEAEIFSRLSEGRYACVMDATHPYAEHITGSIARAAAAAEVRCLRISRKIEKEESKGIYYASDMEQAVQFLNGQEGKVFFSTGSNAAEQYAHLQDLEHRGYVRILPSEKALSKVRSAGFSGGHIMCMQGPFSEEMNLACFRASGAEWLVTKSSGKEGGYDDKMTAAEKLGMKILVIRPPEYEDGAHVCSYEEAACLLRERKL